MEFGLSLEQRQFDDSLRDFLKDRLPMERLRALAEPGGGYDEALWTGLTELGLHGLIVPERFGGAGSGRAGRRGRRRGSWLRRRAGAVRRHDGHGSPRLHQQRDGSAAGRISADDRGGRGADRRRVSPVSRVRPARRPLAWTATS